MHRILLFLLLAVCARASAPLFETTRIFALTPDNKPNYRIPSIIQAPNKDILIITERRNDGPGDIGNHDIVLKRSSDKGRTWSAEQMVFDDEKRVCTDLTIGVADGKLWIFFLRDKKRYVYLTSSDSGATWEGPRDIHEQVTKPEWDKLKGKGDEEEPVNPKGRMAIWEKDWFQRYGCGPAMRCCNSRAGAFSCPRGIARISAAGNCAALRTAFTATTKARHGSLAVRSECTRVSASSWNWRMAMCG